MICSFHDFPQQISFHEKVTGAFWFEKVRKLVNTYHLDKTNAGILLSMGQYHYIQIRCWANPVSNGWNFALGEWVSRVQRPTRHNVGHFIGRYTLGVLHISYSVTDDQRHKRLPRLALLLVHNGCKKGTIILVDRYHQLHSAYFASFNYQSDSATQPNFAASYKLLAGRARNPMDCWKSR